MRFEHPAPGGVTWLWYDLSHRAIVPGSNLTLQ